MKFRLLLVALILITCISGSSCQQQDDFDRMINDIVGPYRFSIVEWELKTLTGELEEIIFNGVDYTADDTLVVIEYFSLLGDISGLENQISYLKDEASDAELDSLKEQLEILKERRDSLKKGVEKILELQIRETLRQLDIYLGDDAAINIDFPPVNFSLESPPHLLVISPRDNIVRMKEMILLQDLTIDEIDYIESEVEKLGYSSIVVQVGGMATFPSFVTNNSSLEFTLSTAVEEWLHQYLFFKPTGFLYALNLLGVYDDDNISTINETIAGIASDEIASILYQNYYAMYFEEGGQTDSEGVEDTGFDYYAEMRNIRIEVDNLLANGEIEKAESFMEEKRLYILSQGYYIRRLNQAYFAFYGTYASSPGSVDPIGDMLWELREKSENITEFLEITSNIKNMEDLYSLIELY
jgi:hypothetical protein